jgi:hypothetical protein
MATRAGAANPFYGRHHTVEARERIAVARRGRAHDPEVRARISASVRLAIESRRAVRSGPL